ncbi:YqgE/AlgH family protein [Auraticoccus monumenti]|uniref:Putative transcriptional regulator n=1 Tax=Auraticoccus monumenti TaxID=675864 RepID=A0A1G7E473_9ACTN|nr:YqgE/AlgH family protein [Auraticoccus monumenti]SDE58528.1 putative transcriptional regulator [Auraticoccus monumenti]
MSAARPRPGDLLVAGPGLSGSIFDHSVVLVLDADEDGALGVILNQLSELSLSSVLPDWVERVSEPKVLFSGGPVSPNGAICVAAVADPSEEPPGWRRLFDNVGLLHLDTPLEIVAGAYDDLRIFAGYAGWEPGQLEAELADTRWYVVPYRYDDVFGSDPVPMWRRVLRRQPGRLAWLSTWSERPELN